MRSNAKAVDIKLTEDDLKEINQILATFEPVGGRYGDAQKAVLVSLRAFSSRTWFLTGSQMR